jgi:hypothetical protein
MIAITFDTDHMTDPMMRVFLRDILPPRIATTFFCYRPFESLAGAGHEIGLHPYFGPASGDWLETTLALRDTIARAMGVTAAGVRPHSLKCSQNFLVQLHDAGFGYVSTVELPTRSPIPAYRHTWGPIEIPIRYMDNMDLWKRDKRGLPHRCFAPEILDMALNGPELFCFDFHPIHIYLNTSTFADYEAWTKAGRPELAQPVERNAYGVRDFFLDLCHAMLERGESGMTCGAVAATVAD